MTTSTGPAARDAVDGRRRARDERGLAPAKPGGAPDRLPRAPRERRPWLAALAVLLIVGGAAVAGLLALRADERVPVLELARDVAAGAQITEADLRTTPVASENALLVPAGALDQVVGQYATVKLTAGQLLDSTMLRADATLEEGQVAVGAALGAGRVPATGLQPGDIVTLVSTATSTVLVERARIGSWREASGGTGGGALVATIIVDESEATLVATSAAAGDLSVVLVQRGVPLGQDG